MLREERFNKADRIIAVGFWANAGLMTMKLLAGYFGKSEAVVADGLESACDFIAILSTMIALKVGRQPFDPKHPYGHGKAESIAAVLVSLVIFSTGIGILVKAVHTITDRTYQTPDLIAVLAALITIGVKEWLYRYTVSTGKRLESPALAAVAKDHRKDAVTSVATLVGVSGAYLGAGIMDPLAAGLTSFFIFHIGYETCMGAIHDLMDGLPSGDLIQLISEVAEAVDGVEHVHEIRGRRSGQYVIIDLKLDMDPEMTVKRSHDIATTVKRLIFEQFPNVGDVMIHINPHDEEHEDLIRL
ncbi:cation diffusion facilitator family transporter [Geobacter hydrogenophilus]|uniref:Cation transporter n=1 Tax=Geobacter hydrogenophilus TaxID=40983 RepID=A0A9W6FYK3_9BACT|nr:cation diffusion facilitator family transporter [Geobacter hydrogenophilus]MBT0894613.1 cation diffusion facilitator family transporter [Geobacter hydrogenophilus]GLI37192.1 cation transporter [Geobacter hydrogenophilus]